MKHLRKPVFIACLIACAGSLPAQQLVKPVSELICPESSAWDRIMLMAGHSKNKVEILQKDSARASKAIFQSQLSTNTLLGSVIYNSGGILIDDGWIRILGSGCTRLSRSVPDWNREKISAMRNEEAFYLLIADDVLGGLFAIKSAKIEDLETIGQVFYYGPNGLTWQHTGLSYSSFISYCFSGNLKDFYDGFRWKGWEQEIKKIDCSYVISCYPMLWTREGLQLKANRKLLAIQTQWNLYQGKRKLPARQKTVAQRQSARPPAKSVPESMWVLNPSLR